MTEINLFGKMYVYVYFDFLVWPMSHTNMEGQALNLYCSQPPGGDGVCFGIKDFWGADHVVHHRLYSLCSEPLLCKHSRSQEMN